MKIWITFQISYQESTNIDCILFRQTTETSGIFAISL
jgi:hypothetical protein